MTHSDTEIVSALRGALAGQIGPERYALWFGPNTSLAMDGDTLMVGAPNPLFQDWLRANFHRPIQHACLVVAGRPLQVVFRVDPALAESKNGSDCPDRAGGPERDFRPGRVDCPDATGPAVAATRRRFADFASFVSGPPNQLARAVAETAVTRPGELSPLVIHGPTAVGKSHLLQAVWTATRQARPRATALYLTAEQFTAAFLQALRGSGLPSFRQKYRGVDLLLLDDLQFFCGKRHTLVELLYTLDTLLREGRQVIVAADRPPEELNELGPDLCTRLQSGMVCRIEPADYEMRLGIVNRMAQRMRIEVPADVKRFIAARLTNHARELSGALCRLQATSQALARPIDLAMAEETLAEMVRYSSRVVRLPDIEKAVCRAFGLDPSSLHSGRKSKRVSQPRMLAMWLARKHTRAGLSEIGEFFGRRSHSTVVSAQKRVEDWLTRGVLLDLAERQWNAEEAIRQVERCLQAG